MQVQSFYLSSPNVSKCIGQLLILMRFILIFLYSCCCCTCGGIVKGISPKPLPEFRTSLHLKAVELYINIILVFVEFEEDEFEECDPKDLKKTTLFAP